MSDDLVKAIKPFNVSCSLLGFHYIEGHSANRSKKKWNCYRFLEDLKCSFFMITWIIFTVYIRIDGGVKIKNVFNQIDISQFVEALLNITRDLLVSDKNKFLLKNALIISKFYHFYVSFGFALE